MKGVLPGVINRNFVCSLVKQSLIQAFAPQVGLASVAL